jgi:hypothetical protein
MTGDDLAGVQVANHQPAVFLNHADTGALISQGHGVLVGLEGYQPGLVGLAGLWLISLQLGNPRRAEVGSHGRLFLLRIVRARHLVGGGVNTGVGRLFQPLQQMGSQL